MSSIAESLPPPSSDALAASRALGAHVRAAIAANGGWIDFARFMELALYTPGLGYYSGGSRKIGAAGDFVTAPELGRWFGRARGCSGRWHRHRDAGEEERPRAGPEAR